jgi:hypothetical protein
MNKGEFDNRIQYPYRSFYNTGNKSNQTLIQEGEYRQE